MLPNALETGAGAFRALGKGLNRGHGRPSCALGARLAPGMPGPPLPTGRLALPPTVPTHAFGVAGCYPKPRLRRPQRVLRACGWIATGSAVRVPLPRHCGSGKNGPPAVHMVRDERPHCPGFVPVSDWSDEETRDPLLRTLATSTRSSNGRATAWRSSACSTLATISPRRGTSSPAPSSIARASD